MYASIISAQCFFRLASALQPPGASTASDAESVWLSLSVRRLSVVRRLRSLRGSGHLAARCRDQFVVSVRGTPQTPAAVGSLGEQHPYPRRRRRVSRCARDQGREPLNEGDLLVAIEGTSVGQDLNPPDQLALVRKRTRRRIHIDHRHSSTPLLIPVHIRSAKARNPSIRPDHRALTHPKV